MHTHTDSKHLWVKTTFLPLLGRKQKGRAKASPELQHKKVIKSMRSRIMQLMSCSSFPFHYHVSNTEFHHCLWLSALLQIYALKKEMEQHRRFSVLGEKQEEQRPLVSTLYIQAARAPVVIFFFYLTCMEKKKNPAKWAPLANQKFPLNKMRIITQSYSAFIGRFPHHWGRYCFLTFFFLTYFPSPFWCPQALLWSLSWILSISNQSVLY